MIKIWICPMCSTSNSCENRKCIVCDATSPDYASLGFDIGGQLDKLSSVLSEIILSPKGNPDDEGKRKKRRPVT